MTHPDYVTREFGWGYFLEKIKLTALFFLKVIKYATQLCPTVCDPMDCSPLGSSVHGILQARMLEWVVISFSRGSS